MSQAAGRPESRKQSPVLQAVPPPLQILVPAMGKTPFTTSPGPARHSGLSKTPMPT